MSEHVHRMETPDYWYDRLIEIFHINHDLRERNKVLVAQNHELRLKLLE